MIDQYRPTFCDQTGAKQGDHRFVLEQAGKCMLFVIGLNPSTANAEKPDPTLRKVIGFTRQAGYDGFIMLNLSSERKTKKEKMSSAEIEDMHLLNLKAISNLINLHPNADILAAFGDYITRIPYLKSYWHDIYDIFQAHHGCWKKIGALTVKGNPRHPLYASYKLGLTDFDAAEYARKIGGR